MNQLGKNNVPAPQALKDKIVKQIRDEGMSVTEASAQCGYSTKAIYRWLKGDVVNSEASLVLQLNKLKKENEQLYALLGRATAEMQRSKK